MPDLSTPRLNWKVVATWGVAALSASAPARWAVRLRPRPARSPCQPHRSASSCPRSRISASRRSRSPKKCSTSGVPASGQFRDHEDAEDVLDSLSASKPALQWWRTGRVNSGGRNHGESPPDPASVRRRPKARLSMRAATRCTSSSRYPLGDRAAASTSPTSFTTSGDPPAK